MHRSRFESQEGEGKSWMAWWEEEVRRRERESRRKEGVDSGTLCVRSCAGYSFHRSLKGFSRFLWSCWGSPRVILSSGDRMRVKERQSPFPNWHELLKWPRGMKGYETEEIHSKWQWLIPPHPQDFYCFNAVTILMDFLLCWCCFFPTFLFRMCLQWSDYSVYFTLCCSIIIKHLHYQ